MNQPVIAVFDKKTGTYGSIFICRHVGEAIREWDIIRKDTNTKYGKTPEDFDLWQLGEFDESKGAIQNEPRIQLASGV